MTNAPQEYIAKAIGVGLPINWRTGFGNCAQHGRCQLHLGTRSGTSYPTTPAAVFPS